MNNNARSIPIPTFVGAMLTTSVVGWGAAARVARRLNRSASTTGGYIVTNRPLRESTSDDGSSFSTQAWRLQSRDEDLRLLRRAIEVRLDVGSNREQAMSCA